MSLHQDQRNRQKKAKGDFRLYAIILATATAVAISGCAREEDEPAPPTSAELSQLAAQDAKQYVGKQQCVKAFDWPVALPAKPATGEYWDPRGTLDALVTVGLVQRKLEYKKDTADGQNIVEATFVYSPSVKAAPYLREEKSGEPVETGKTRQSICLGKFVSFENVTQDGFFLQTGYSFIFHEAEGTFVHAARDDKNVPVSRLNYDLKTDLSDEAFQDFLAKTLGKSPEYAKKNREAYWQVYSAVFPHTKVDVVVKQVGATWEVTSSKFAKED